MMPSRPSSHLLLLPGGLAVGHAISYSVLGPAGHVDVWFAGSVEGLLCVAVPLAVAALVRAVVAGLRDEPAPIRFAPLAALQVALFLVVEVVEHAGSAARPSVLLAVALGVAAQVVAAALVCALVHGATALGRRARGRRTRPRSDAHAAGQLRPRRSGWSTLLLLPQQRRGPPLALA